jgi:hypothetical protein
MTLNYSLLIMSVHVVLVDLLLQATLFHPARSVIRLKAVTIGSNG